ncbi:hypothetical protein Syun_019375 [Stephania yunnanensis]|uniref:Uncharacterized protein n=1 Tax=Stephania yunnanensis TaxID=152371 RepID=A0AAP0IVQ2_9MAGN
MAKCEFYFIRRIGNLFEQCSLNQCSQALSQILQILCVQCILKGLDHQYLSCMYNPCKACIYIRPLELDNAYVIEGVKVVLLEANHYPGATLILFHLADGRCYLHTGDFRASKKDVLEFVVKMTRNYIKNQPNTICLKYFSECTNSVYEHFFFLLANALHLFFLVNAQIPGSAQGLFPKFSSFTHYKTRDTSLSSSN